MEKTLERLKIDVANYPTVSTAISGTTVYSMADYRHSVMVLTAHRLPDALGEGVITASIYQTTNSVLNGKEIAASVVTASLTSASDVVLKTEINVGDIDVANDYAYIYPYVVGSTSSDLAVTIVRDVPRYEPQSN